MRALIEKLSSLEITLKTNGENIDVFDPHGHLTTDLVAEIKSNKSHLLQLLAGIEAPQKEQDYEIPVATERDFYPLSSAQKRIYFIYEFDPSSTAYNMPQHLLLRGKLDHKRLESAFRQVLQRHMVFRSQFLIVDEEPVQQILPEVNYELEFHKSETADLSEETLQAFVRPFDLAKAPLVRAGLYSFDDATHHLLVDMHHIAADGVSMSILIRDLAHFYEGVDVPSLNIQFKDYAVWQEERNQDQSHHQAFWKSQYESLPTPLVLPYDRDRTVVRGNSGGHVLVTMEPQVQKKLQAIANELGATPYMALLAVYNILLARLSNQNDLVVGTPVAGRDHADLQDLVGMFVRTLPIRTQINAQDSFKDYLRQVKQTSLACFDHQEYPYEVLVQDLNIQRETSRNPLFDTLFVYQNFDYAALELSGLEVSNVPVSHNQVKFDLSLTVIDAKDDWKLDFQYASDLFDAETVERFAIYLKKIADSIVNDPDQAIGELEMLPSEERTFLLEAFNATRQSYHDQPLIPAAFDVKANTYADQVAVIDSDGSKMTYRQLRELSDQIASFLITEKRVSKGQLVGVMLEREKIGMPVIYGLLKAGAVYVPIDPQFPVDRKNTILQDSEVDMLISRGEYLQDVATDNLSLINLDKVTDFSHCAVATLPEVQGDDLAYIIHTSGSTGKPKGVEIQHDALKNIIYSLESDYPLGADGCYLLKTNYCFDVSIAEIFGWFHGGGFLAMLPPKAERDPYEMLRFIDTHRITHLNFVPSMFAEFLTALETEGISQISSLKYIFLAGEALPKELVHRFFELDTDILLENIYGPTEGTIYSCAYGLRPGQLFSRGVPIGKPLHNIQLYILNKNLALVPQGVEGELYIGGAGVAKGYRHQHLITQKSFISNPFVPGTRLYKSGDVVRLDRQGNIEYLGRADHQVKIRGFRVETGEIEDHLNAHPDVQRSVILLYERGDQKELVAYYESNVSINFHDLREHLQESLPEYMIPAHLIGLDKFPTTANGKLDRSALPSPTVKVNDHIVPPQTEEQHLLASVWKEVLGVAQVGIKDGFFLSGGDSIKSIQLVSRLRVKGYELSVNDVILNQTLEKIALKLRQISRKVDQQEVVGHFGLSPIQQWFFEGNATGLSHYNHSILLDFDKQELSLEEANAMLQHLYQHHDALRITFDCTTSGWVQHNHPFSPVSLVENFDLHHSDKPEKDFIQYAEQLQSNFDLENGPLIKAGLFHTEEKSRLLIVVHHALIDGVSWRIVFEDLQTLYDQAKAEKEFQLPLKTDSYKSWVAALGQYQESSSFAQALAYWEQTQKRELNTLPVPNPEGSLQEKVFRKESIRFSKSTTEKILGPAHEALNTQVNDLLITALLLALSDQFGVNKVNVDLEGHGREEISKALDISRSIGWFTSIYPCAFHTDHKLSLTRNLKQTKEALRQIPNKGLDYLLWKHNQSSQEINPAQVSFNYLGQFNTDLEGMAFEVSQDARGPEISPLMNHAYELECSGFVQANTLQVNLSYSAERFPQEIIKSVLTKFEGYLEQIIGYCTQESTQCHTPSDLSYSELSIEEVEDLEAEFELEDVIRLSPTQEGMLYHALVEPTSLNYFQQMSFDLSGNVDASAIEKALKIITDRHEVFRTHFVPDRFAHPVQVISKNQGIAFSYEDWSGNDEKDPQALVNDFLEKDRENLFDLTKDALMRVTLLKLDEHLFHLVWSHHHIIMDGWSFGIVLREFTAHFKAISEGLQVHMAPATPYSQYLNWINDRDPRNLEDFWSKNLEGFDEVSVIPSGKTSNQTAGTGLYSKTSIQLEEEVTKTLTSSCQEWGVTLNSLVQACWTILLSRFNNANDVLFGYTVSGRPAHIAEVESMVGLCINTIPMRIRFDAKKDTIQDLMAIVQNNATECQPHQFDALNLIQKSSGIDGSLFDHIMVFENFPINEALQEEDQFQVGEVSIFEQTNYPLTLIVNPAREMSVEFRYDQEVYESETIERIAAMFNKLLVQAPNIVDQQIGKIDIIDEEERQLILQDFNDTGRPFPSDQTIIDLFDKSCCSYPDRVALRFGDQSLTYQEFGARVNQYATYLRKAHHIQNEDVIAIVSERSIDMLVAIFGILKSGAVYLPVDPKFPASKVAYMIEKSEAKLILHAPDYKVTFDTEAAQQEISHSKLHSFSDKPVQNWARPEDLAYIIFTSGSTGKPKGVMVEHHSLTNRIHWMQESYPLNGSDVILQKTPLIFDVSVWELFWWVCNGSTLSILAPGAEKDPASLIKEIERSQVTTMHFVPTMLHAFLEYLEGDQINMLASLKQVFSSGEALLFNAVNQFKDQLNLTNGTRLINLYGPTEATIDVSFFNCFEQESREILPIGKPIHNTQLYVLSADLKMQPVGVKGDLYIAGEGLARGYVGAPDLTHERFITSPFDASQRLYSTGDVARWLPDGNLEFLGRSDHQVKIKGFRIELGEIEFHLTQHPLIQEAVVLIKEKGHEKFLVGYVTSQSAVSSDELKNFLSDRLQEYMIPGHYLVLDNFPQTPSGKIDRKALPEPEWADDSHRVYVAPVNRTETELARIWKEVLKREPISVDQDFFKLGGDSIISIRLVAKVNKAFNSNISIADLYKYSTIRDMATNMLSFSDDGEFATFKDQVAKEVEVLKAKVLPTLTDPDEVEDVYPMSDIERGMVFYSEANPEDIAYYDQFNYLVKFNDFSEEAFKKALLLMGKKHASLRTAYEISGLHGEIRKIYRDPNINFQFKNLSTLERASQGDYIQEFMYQAEKEPFNIREKSLWRVHLFYLGADNYNLLFQFHHAILDGWSVATFFTELYAVYMALLTDPDFKPEQLSVSYKDYVLGELTQKRNLEVTEFWESYLNNYKRLDLFSKQPAYHMQKFVVEEELTRQLLECSARHQLPIQSILFTAYISCFQALSYDQDLTVGIVTSNRPALEGSDQMLGCFLNTLPFRLTKWDTSEGGLALVQMVHEHLIELKEKQGLSLLEIAKRLDESSIDQNPFFDTVFNFVDFHVFDAIGKEERQYLKAAKEQKVIDTSNVEETNTLLDFIVDVGNDDVRVKIVQRREMKIDKKLSDLFQMFQNTLKFLVHDKTAFNNLDLMPKEEVKVLQAFNPVATATSENLTIVDLFEAQAANNPDQNALLNQEGELTYRALNDRSNQLAYHLKAIGVVPESRVAILLEPGFDVVIAILGIMKAGGAYIPIDPKAPEERINFQLEDSKCQALITHQSLLDAHSWETDRELIVDIYNLPAIEDTSVNPTRVNTGKDLAYIIYTSGSTGRPKGVMVEHEGVHNAIHWRAEEYEMDHTDRILLLLNYVFDGFLLTLMTPLASGSSVFIHDQTSVMDAQDLARIIDEYKISQMSLMPALYSVILDELQLDNPYHLRQVTLAGEAIDRSVLEKSEAIFPQVELSDEYGPTENSIVSTAYRGLSSDQPVSIGKPIKNTGVCILNERGDLQPVGVPGEIGLFGVGLARGYLNNEKLTQAQFVRHSYLAQERMYKTGDLGRWLPDGNIEFLGRIDSQVKIRGFRVELGEIEAQLNQLPDIREAVVNYDNKKQLLVAYYVSDRSIETHDLQSMLAQSLPYYMVPSHLIKLDRIPLTKIGKLDRKALPPIEVSMEMEREAPTNTIEQSLIEIWSEVLSVEEQAVGTNMNFFDLGGNSITLMQMVNKVNARFERKIPVAKVFAHPNISTLSSLIAENGVPVIELEKISEEDISERDDLLDLFTRG